MHILLSKLLMDVKLIFAVWWFDQF